MKKVCVALILALLCLAPGLSVAAENPVPAEKLAMLAALDFLELADQGEFARCWETASQLFHDQIDKDAWQQEIGHLRSQYGENQARALQFVKPLDASADAGNRLFLIFRSNFAQKTAAEMVTLNQDSDDQWRVAGYSIQ